jgi:hypothetical protein
MALTDVAIRNAKPRAKPYKMGDAFGLFVLIQPSGGKLWRFKYRFEGREKKLAIGTYPVIGLTEAPQADRQLNADHQVGRKGGTIVLTVPAGSG